MSEQVAKAAAAIAPASGAGMLQRKCACGNHTVSGETCDSCKKKQKNGGMAILRYSGGGDVGGLALSQPGDALEREADAFAMRIAGPGPMPTAPGGAPASMSGAANGGRESAERIVHSVINRPGAPLPRAVRERMEQGFGHDFGGVRIHADADAARSSDAVGALAYTVGQSIVFGRGQYLPETPTGQRLLAHELTHVVQQRSGRVAPMIARDPPEEGATCDKGHRIGENVKHGDKPKGDTVVYMIWGTWKSDDTSDKFLRRTFSEWIRWRFGGIDAKQSGDVLAYAMKHMAGDAPAVAAGCQVGITVDFSAMTDIRRLSGEVTREKAAAEKKKAEAEAAKAAEKPAGDPSGDATASPGDAPAGDKPEGDSAGGGQAGGDKSGGGAPPPTGDMKGEPGGKPSIGDFGPMSEAAAEDEVLDQYLTTKITPDITVLADARRAELYLQVLQHYTGRAISDADTKAAADGLTEAEVDAITDGKPMRKALTALYGQGWREFEKAGGSEPEKFSILIQTVCEQFSRGNPTATHNQLKIGKGVPEKVLGIVERSTDIQLYDDLGVALASFGGVGTRDRGYIATKIDKDAWGFNIAKVKDPGLRELLNSLRLTFSEPTRMAIAGAEVYFNNIELVNGKVQAGLDAKIKEKFVDMLPFFVGFIAGHAVSSFLMRVPNPHVAAVGLTLKGLLTAAGYVMEIDFAAGAMERLLSAAALLSKFERDEADQVTRLSEGNLDAAAKIIQDMVAEIAAMFATMALGRLLSGARKGTEKLKIECTHCDLKGGKAAEAKSPTAEAKPGEAKPGEAKPAEAKPGEAKPNEGAAAGPKAEAKPEAKPSETTPQEKAKQRLTELGAEKTAKQKALADLRAQREALRQEHNQAVDAKNEAVKEWDAAKGDKAKAEAARAKAREANDRAQKAQEKMDELPSEEGLSKEVKKLEGEIGIEGIKADPTSRGLLPCFAPDTLVWTPEGPRPIAELRAGDRIWTFDFSSGARRARPVLQLRHGSTLAFHRVRTDRGEIRATSQHRFWVESDLAWRTAETLQPGEVLRGTDGERLRVLENLREAVDAAATCTLSVDEFHNYYVGPGALVHNEPVDVGLGGDFVIYRGTNPDYPSKVYIGQTTDLDVHGEARGSEARQGEHQKLARKKLAEHASGTKKLSARDKAFYEFMKDATLEPIVKGIGTQDQCDFLEQRNIDLERQVSGKDNVMNRRNEITKDSHMKDVIERIKADPAVKAKGYCP
jgi:hypothetical protein